MLSAISSTPPLVLPFGFTRMRRDDRPTDDRSAYHPVCSAQSGPCNQIAGEPMTRKVASRRIIRLFCASLRRRTIEDCPSLRVIRVDTVPIAWRRSGPDGIGSAHPPSSFGSRQLRVEPDRTRSIHSFWMFAHHVQRLTSVLHSARIPEDGTSASIREKRCAQTKKAPPVGGASWCPATPNLRISRTGIFHSLPLRADDSSTYRRDQRVREAVCRDVTGSNGKVEALMSSKGPSS